MNNQREIFLSQHSRKEKRMQDELDKTIMDIFDREFEDARSKIFDKIEDLFGEDFSDSDIDPYYMFYYKLIIKQLESHGIEAKDISVPNFGIVLSYQ